VTLVIAEDDTDATLARPDGRRNGAAGIVDPVGHRWMLNGPVPAAADPIRHGDLAYLSVQPVDVDAAARFYAAVLGWEYDTDAGPRRGVVGVAGGQVIDCGDTLGTAFALFQARPDVPRPAVGISYMTYETTDAAAFREFYGMVLGWQFVPSSAPDGWQVISDITPMTGVGGGANRTAMVPMWQVGDVVAATERVVAADGRVLDGPVQRPYGLIAECVDDQGMRFYIGE
jgi:predicted enzyme related to lactoylglutathione lyase